MPGLIGYVKRDDLGSTDLHLGAMANALESDSRFKHHLYEGDGFGLGRVSLDILNPQTQPIWNKDQDLCVVMEGELYDQRLLRQTLEQRGVHFQTDSDVELILYLYDQYGEDFVTLLNGLFAIAIWDGKQRKMLVVNDRFGLQPIYYARTSNGLIFASGLRSLLIDPTLPRRIDRLAIGQFLTFEHVLDDRTLLEDVKLLPHASILTFHQAIVDDDQMRIHPYWMMKYADTYPLCSETDFVEELKHLIRQAVTRCVGGNISKGILLSGGKDSRYLLGELVNTISGDPLHTFTWGIPGCDDSRAANELAKIAGTRHHFFELKPDWLLDHAIEAVRITDGLGNLTNLHALAIARDASKFAQVVYKGTMGDVMMGSPLVKRFWGSYDENTWFQAHLQTHIDQGRLLFNLQEHKQLFTNEFQQRIGDGIIESYRNGMKQAGSPQMGVQRLFFDITHRVTRMTLNGVEVMRSYAPVRLPFCDNDLFDFTLRVPLGFLFERRLSIRAFCETHPSLAKVPVAMFGLPMIACSRDIIARTSVLAQWHLRNHGLSKLAGGGPRPYKDYNLWFRTVLRQWLQDTLLSPTALDRGYFNPQFMRNLISEHMAGANHASRLGAFLSLELWHRQFID
jgi:asparagine synthase (glutamine-hydrolysing)